MKPDRRLQRELIELFIDEALAGSKGIRRLTKRARAAQERLRSVVDAEGWTAYLSLEAVVNERTSLQLRRLTRRLLGTKLREP